MQLEFQAFGSRKVVGDFEGGRLSTDGGALLLRQADALLDLTPRLAATTGARGGSSIRCGSWSPSGCSVFCRVTRTSTTMTSSGPTACWRWLSGDLTGEEQGRDRGIPLAGSTVNRSGRARRGRDAPVQEGRGRGRSQACPLTLVRRREIFLDVDSTDDPVHGNQEGRHFHGYSYCYLPLYRNDLILCSRLRPANVDPAAGAEEELARERIRKHWPETKIVVRGDGGFCRDGTWCEDNGVDYLFGLSRNARLTERIGRQLRKSRSRCVSTGAASRRFCDFRYRRRGAGRGGWWRRGCRVLAARVSS